MLKSSTLQASVLIPVFHWDRDWWPPRISWVWRGTCSAWTVSPAPAVVDWWRQSWVSESCPAECEDNQTEETVDKRDWILPAAPEEEMVEETDETDLTAEVEDLVCWCCWWTFLVWEAAPDDDDEVRDEEEEGEEESGWEAKKKVTVEMVMEMVKMILNIFLY